MIAFHVIFGRVRWRVELHSDVEVEVVEVECDEDDGLPYVDGGEA